MRPTRFIPGLLAAAALLTLAACGGGGDSSDVTINLSNDRGSIQRNPPTQLASLTAAQFTAQLRGSAQGQQLLQLAGVNLADPAATLPCGLDLRYIQYGTVGGAGEKTNATGALLIPTGGTGCSGARPIVLHAHGTTTAKDYNIALLGSTTNAAGGEAGLIAALYAAQGMIVVAPNYAGYENSALSYHPYLNADQQSKDMIDALSAGRQAVAKIANGTSDSGKLLITGYSQGAHVAMATAKALRLAGQPVTAVAGGSGPYALAKFADAIFGGSPIVGGTLFAPLLTTSWKRSYGDIYQAAGDVYNTAYATGIETLVPSTLTQQALFTTGKLPQAALFDTDAAAFGLASASFQPLFGAPGSGLIKTTYANAVLADAAANPCNAASPAACVTNHPLRARAKQNDLRGGWAPAFPVFMCGGANDPTVFYVNTQLQAAWFGTLPLPTGTVTTLDLETAPTGGTDPFAAAKVGFQTAIAGITGGATAVAQNYHATVAPFCTASTAGFFRSVLAATP
ncbi:alpha/beta hydrolase family protein [Leptothrix discophora]|uniref:Alpha/beta hydrolase n=1 Tax=Leptothrix discophora TaxID=89 RepID=A0ABT9FZF0_LEPDI|nr:alpha/beta hydrolase [Leptothrix discophora]MDP4299600.1 alpha/beta hydrolase [Leptothrix discophora]